MRVPPPEGPNAQCCAGHCWDCRRARDCAHPRGDRRPPNRRYAALLLTTAVVIFGPATHLGGWLGRDSGWADSSASPFAGWRSRKSDLGDRSLCLGAVAPSWARLSVGAGRAGGMGGHAAPPLRRHRAALRNAAATMIRAIRKSHSSKVAAVPSEPYSAGALVSFGAK